jgi:predicted metal-dependent hydrolase
MKSARQLQREVDDFLRGHRSQGARGHARKAAKFACPNCDGGLVLEDTYGLVCPACEARVAGPFESADEVPDYKPARRGRGGEVLLPKRRTGHAKKLPPASVKKAPLKKALPKKTPPKKAPSNTQTRAALRASIQRFLDKWQPRLGISVDKWNLRKMKKYWGSSRRPGCDEFACRDGHITFNTDMAKLPERHQEYLVVHELVHQVTDGHDAKFYSLMDRHLPKWREMQAQIEEPLTRYS